MHTPRVQVQVERNWLTQSYDVAWSIVDHADKELATGVETYGPLWEPEQVERLVGVFVTALVRVWMREPAT